jgi:UPF0755 protein
MFANKKKIGYLIGGFVLVIGLGMYLRFFASNTTFNEAEQWVTIPTGSNFEAVKKIMDPYIDGMGGFENMAAIRRYDSNVKPGRFLLKKGIGNFGLVAALRHNIPVKLTFNNQERLEDLCVRFSQQIEPDTTQLISVFRDSLFLKEQGFTKANVMAMFIPNSYEFYWNISAITFRDKMLKEYNKFWNADRLAKAEKVGLSPIDVIILASIVHKETVKKEERPRVAGAYLNRLKQGMPLQADPTVIYALKLKANDFTQVIKRVLFKDLTLSSPYNTYVNIGLPPGPIAMPDITAIDAVLNPEKHNYIYFCASIERFGYHEFAVTYPEHQVNAKKYADWINSTGTTR